jgi:hydrogenase maturation protease
MRGDDAAGPLICDRLDFPLVADCGDAPERYMGLAGDGRVERVLLVDAADFSGEVGEMTFILAGDLVERFGTTHTSGLAVLSRFIGEAYGKPVAVLGIQPNSTAFGAAVSTAVRGTVEEVSALLNGAASRWEAGRMEAAWSPS